MDRRSLLQGGLSAAAFLAASEAHAWSPGQRRLSLRGLGGGAALLLNALTLDGQTLVLNGQTLTLGVAQ